MRNAALLRTSAIAVAFLSLSLFAPGIFGQAKYRVASAYEDTVRIVVLWNQVTGDCQSTDPGTTPIGNLTLNHIIAALDTVNHCHNVKVLPVATTQWSTILNLWPGKLPHTIVHSNAGWYTANGNYLYTVADSAVANHIGWVEVGDDAAYISANVFGYTGVNNVPAPMYDATMGAYAQATYCCDSLWIGLNRPTDNLLKNYDPRYAGVLLYPYSGTGAHTSGGVISNAIDSIMKPGTGINPVLNFFPYNQGRCQADADQYTATKPTYELGYQMGLSTTHATTYGDPNSFFVIAVLQDTVLGTTGGIVRRAINLSYEPTFLVNTAAAQQVTYDACMYSSRAYTLVFPQKMVLIHPDTIIAGDTALFSANLLDRNGNIIYDTTFTNHVFWTMDPDSQRAGDRFLTNIGDSVRFTATLAWRHVGIIATYYFNSGISVDTTVWIWVAPAAVNHMVIEASSQPRSVSPNVDNPLGGATKTITFNGTVAVDSGWSVLRDQFGNYVSFSLHTLWGSTDTTIAKAANGNRLLGGGVFTKSGTKQGQCKIGSKDSTTLKVDTILVIVDTTSYNGLRIMRYNVTQGGLVTITSDTVAMDDSTTLYVQGHRADGLDPNKNGGWENVSGNWSMSPGLYTSRVPPQNQNSWTFSPTDTGSGTIYVGLPGNSSLIASITAVFLPGKPNSIALYPQAGAPSATNVPWPALPTIADSTAAGATYTKIYAKLFYNNIWLPKYQDSTSLASQITWSVAPTDKDSLTSLNNYYTGLRSTRAYRNVSVTATWNGHTSTMLIRILPGAPTHMDIEATVPPTDSGSDQPLASITIGSSQVSASVYALLRDAFGNFVTYSTTTQWSSSDTTKITADTGSTAVGQGFAFRQADSGTALLIAFNSTHGYRDTVQVILSNIYYDTVRIYTLDANLNKVFHPADTVSISTDSSLSLYAEGWRSDGKGWDNVPVTWSLGAGLKTRTNPPALVDQWLVLPDSVGKGVIRISRTDNGKTWNDSLWVLFTPGKPSQMLLYRHDGPPLITDLFPATDTVISEGADTLVSKVFDRNGQWIPHYDTLAFSKPVMSWTITKLSGPGAAETVLGATTGQITTYHPRIAYATYQIKVRFISGSTLLTDSAYIYVKPGAAAQLVIEAGAIQPGVTPPNLLVGDHPIDTLTLGPTDSVYSNVYAVLRDKDSNFVSMSSSTIWNTLNPLVVTASEYVAQYGQGLITRIAARVDTTKVVAINRLNLNLFDSMTVKLDSVSYSALRIVVGDLYPITSLSMTTDADTALEVQADRKGVWESVQANWQFIGTSTNLSATNVHQWLFAPATADSGIIIVSLGSSLKDTITVKIRPGAPAAVVLYGSSNPPGTGNPSLAGPPQLISCAAGAPFTMSAKVFDRHGAYLSQYEPTTSGSTYSGNFSWSAVSSRGSMNAFLHQPLDSAVQSYNSPRAGDTVSVVVTFILNSQVMPKDTVLLVVKPGPATHMVLELTPNNTNTPNPVDTLIIQGSQQTNSVYAILRDANNNFVAYDNITSFGSTDTADVTVSVQQLGAFSCQLQATRRVQTGASTIYAADQQNFRDSCAVKLLPYGYTALRIVTSNTTPITTLTMTDNQDSTVYVQGLRQDTALWVTIPNATWQISQNLVSPKVVLPGNGASGASFTLAPTDTGNGWIRVTLGEDAVTKPDTLQLHIMPGGPVAASMQIITPTDSLIAGRPIKAVVTITDKNGNPVRMPDTLSAFYHDTLGRGGLSRPEPFLVADNDSIFLDASPAAYARENFVNGVDTVTFTLFYAARNDSSHQITVTLKGSNATPLVASTAPFTLLPAAIQSIRLEYPNYTLYPDTVNVGRNDTLTIFSRGFDQYGNLIGDIGTKWSVTNPLPPPTDTTDIRTSAIYIGNQAPQDEQGYLISTYSGSVALADSLYFFVKGPPVMLTRALTRAYSGDGLLDAVEMHFNRAVQLPGGTVFLSGISVNHGSTIFYPDSIIGAGARTDSVWILAIQETVGATQGQTGWTLSLTIPSDTTINLAGSTISTNDGAGPAIWSVTKLWVSSTVHDSDLVTVTFSEPVQINGAVIPQNTAPGAILNVWGKPDSSDSNFLNTATLAGIPALNSVNDTEAVIRMSNDSNVTAKQYFNIIYSGTNTIITDDFNNPPNANNKKCPVLVTGSPTAPLTSIPNPMRPSGAGGNSGAFNLVNDPNYQSVPTDHGTIFSFGVPIYPTMLHDVNVQASIKVYDALGTLVTAAANTKFVQFDPGTNSFSFDGGTNGLTPTQVSGNIAHVYWNGVNGHGMTIAPGIYRVVVDLHYADQGSGSAKQFKDQRSIANLGVRR